MQTLTNENNFTYAGFFTRLLAYAIDMIIASVCILIVKSTVLSGLGEIELFSKPMIFCYSIMDVITYLLKVSYFIICIFCAETTVGKYAMKLKVVKKDGSKLSLFNIIYRETIGRFISSFAFVGYLLVLIDKENAALHDKLCDSRVIYACNIKKTILVRQQPVCEETVAAPTKNTVVEENKTEETVVDNAEKIVDVDEEL